MKYESATSIRKHKRQQDEVWACSEKMKPRLGILTFDGYTPKNVIPHRDVKYFAPYYIKHWNKDVNPDDYYDKDRFSTSFVENIRNIKVADTYEECCELYNDLVKTNNRAQQAENICNFDTDVDQSYELD